MPSNCTNIGRSNRPQGAIFLGQVIAGDWNFTVVIIDRFEVVTDQPIDEVHTRNIETSVVPSEAPKFLFGHVVGDSLPGIAASAE